MTTIRGLLGAMMVLAFFGVAMAKLPPAPPLTDPQKVAAAEKKAKDAVAAEATKVVHTRAEDRTAARYYAEMRAKGKAVAPPQMAATSPTGPAVSRQPEKQGAHSPPQTKR
ncbi:MAG: formate dehydrogenase [Betaproteobacteria bacterium]